jgi:DNA adenine methylase
MRAQQTFTARLSASPFIKWAGGKTQLLTELEKNVPNFVNYFEPFLGGGALFFRLAVKKTPFTAYLSDANTELINAYHVVKNDLSQLISELRRHDRAYKKNPVRYYYELRNASPAGRVQRAARLIALNKTCYNGLYRVNSRGEFNVPMGRYKNPVICDEKMLGNASAMLNRAGAVLGACDFRIALRGVQEGDFVYLDPPFVPLSQTANFVNYTQNGFAEKDQLELSRMFRELDRKKCKVLLSNSDTASTRDLYGGFRLYSVQVTRAISSKAVARSGYSELLVSNY